MSVHVETALGAKIIFLVAAAQCCFTYDVTICFYLAPKRVPVLLSLLGTNRVGNGICGFVVGSLF